MTTKEARAGLRRALLAFRRRVRLPRVTVQDIIESEDLQAIGKEVLNQVVQRFVQRRR